LAPEPNAIKAQILTA